LLIDNVTWFDSDYTFLRANSFFYNTHDTTLHLDLTSAYSGNDVLGGSQSIQFDYSLFDDTLTSMNCTITTYNDYNLIKFTQVKDKILFLFFNLISFDFNFLSIFHPVLSNHQFQILMLFYQHFLILKSKLFRIDLI